LFVAVPPPETPNALQSACKRRLPSTHLAVFWRPQIRFYSGCASLRPLGRLGSAPPRQAVHPGISVACRLRRSSPCLIQLQIAKARDKQVRGVLALQLCKRTTRVKRNRFYSAGGCGRGALAGWNLERFSFTWSHAIGKGHAIGRRLSRRPRSQVMPQRIPPGNFSRAGRRRRGRSRSLGAERSRA
jgi:hypothetical protein